MPEQPRVRGVFERARHAVISTLLNHFDGKGGYSPQRKILFDHFVLAMAKDGDFREYAKSLSANPETRYHSDRMSSQLDQRVYLPGAGLLVWSRLPNALGRAARAVEASQHLGRKVPLEEIITPEPEDPDVVRRNNLWMASLVRAGDLILGDLHNEAALKRTVIAKNKKQSGGVPARVHESFIHLTPQHAVRLRELASDAHSGSD